MYAIRFQTKLVQHTFSTLTLKMAVIKKAFDRFFFHFKIEHELHISMDGVSYVVV